MLAYEVLVTQGLTENTGSDWGVVVAGVGAPVLVSEVAAGELLAAEESVQQTTSC